MRVAVSGVNGFVGRHLTRELVAAGHDVVGIGHGDAAPELSDLLTEYVAQDLTAAWPEDRADAVVHLAGLSAVGPSYERPQEYLVGNSAPVTHLCESLLRQGRTPRVVVVSTGAVYDPGVGLTERSATRATSPYAVSKLLVETQCDYYRRRGLDLTVMRPFNHIGPGQQAGFLLPDLVAGVAKGSLVVGDLDTRRDYTDVRDVARAYRLAVEATGPVEPLLNVCSGVSLSGRELLDTVLEATEGPRVDVVVDPARLRPGDPRDISGDASLARRTLGWAPEISLSTTVRDAVDAAAAERHNRPSATA